MLFSSITFLYYFLPITLILYFIVPKGLKNAILLLVSLIFYAWGEPVYIFLMIVSIASGYGFGLLIEKFRGTKRSKILTGISVGISLSMLIYFKYLPFVTVALPIGISFYTFQIISYTVDVYRGEKAQRNPFDLATYITMFPQLIAGPIVRYSTIAEQLKERSTTIENISQGIRRFLIGLGKKILIANQLGELCALFKASSEPSVLFTWLYAIALCLQIYYDFSGYSDMAIGLGHFFGFTLPENFNYPFISKSITEFWRRWHMSLGTWFRDYVYIPLGGNRVSKIKWFRNIFIVWMLTGYWHGADWNFVAWGLFFGIFLIIEKNWLLRHLEKLPALAHIYVIFLLLISFIIFDNSISQAFIHIKGMFGFAGLPLLSETALYYGRKYLLLLVLAILGSTPVVKQLTLKIPQKVLAILEPLTLCGLLLLATAYLVDGSFNPFLYFRF